MSATGLGLIVPGATDELWPKLIVPYAGGAPGAWVGANSAIYVRFRVAIPRTATGLTVGMGAASGAGYSAIYSSDGTTLTKLVASASITTAGANTKQDYAFTAQVPLSPGIDLWARMSFDNTTVTLLRVLAGLTTFGPQFLAFGAVASSLIPGNTELIANLVSTASGYVPTIAVY